MINAYDIHNEIGTIKDVISENIHSYSLGEYKGWFRESQLDPYAEENKEINNIIC